MGTYGYECHAAQDAEDDDNPTAAEEDDKGDLLLEVELGFVDYLAVHVSCMVVRSRF